MCKKCEWNWFITINRNLRNKPAIWESDEAAPEEQVQEEGEVVTRHDHDLAVREVLENSFDRLQGLENLDKSEIKLARVGKVWNARSIWKPLFLQVSSQVLWSSSTYTEQLLDVAPDFHRLVAL